MNSMFGLRRKAGSTYRKTLGYYNYKIGHMQYHKEQGAVNLHTVETLKKINTPAALLKLREMRLDSPRVMGHFNGRKFMIDPKKVPYYDIPDLTGFKLSPYVSYHTPKVDQETMSKITALNDFTQQQNLLPRSGTALLMKK